MALLRKQYGKLKLQINGAKSAVANALGRVWGELYRWRRAIQLWQWKRDTTMYRKLEVQGAKESVARLVVAISRNSAKLLNSVLTIGWVQQLGLPRLS